MLTNFAIHKTVSDNDYDKLSLEITITNAIGFDALFEELEKAVQDIKAMKTSS